MAHLFTNTSMNNAGLAGCEILTLADGVGSPSETS
eukprot:CAMPEP_0194036732 /NCGR_PEP_ID=MMETSP0009_2-20130614/9102_1 /TAXON_ID=210454 /ORGANISM="Grammatophora oceanica, Strain CCMP 410" /LENGTH=34 /DNA_ID= /DNA_START= /DNA_END= /DNA_ORIENTATION=